MNSTKNKLYYEKKVVDNQLSVRDPPKEEATQGKTWVFFSNVPDIKASDITMIFSWKQESFPFTFCSDKVSKLSWF